jgi:hypothetical protein
MATKQTVNAANTNKTTALKKPQKIDPDKLFIRLSANKSTTVDTKKPILGLDDEVTAIYRQAGKHRNRLINFFIIYTIGISIFVLGIIILQAFARMLIKDEHTIELIPQWALYLLVVGLFGQFIGLLTIVTKKVWTFEAFFKHADASYHHDSDK